jgi:hypothetical protein
MDVNDFSRRLVEANESRNAVEAPPGRRHVLPESEVGKNDRSLQRVFPGNEEIEIAVPGQWRTEVFAALKVAKADSGGVQFPRELLDNP